MYPQNKQRRRELYAILLACFEFHMENIGEVDADAESYAREAILLETLRDATPVDDTHTRVFINEYLATPNNDKPYLADWFESRLVDLDEYFQSHRGD